MANKTIKAFGNEKEITEKNLKYYIWITLVFQRFLVIVNNIVITNDNQKHILEESLQFYINFQRIKPNAVHIKMRFNC